MRIAIIREGKVPPDARVPMSPEQVKDAASNHENLEFTVEASPIRCFADTEYERAGMALSGSLSEQDADVYIGVKEVPMSQLIPNSTYVFFSHTAKMQPYNRDLLKSIVEKKITLIDWEYLTNGKGARLIGFGRYAGIVGAYNGLRAYGLRTGRYELKPAHLCEDRREVSQELKKVDLPGLNILLTGRGRVAQGAMEILDEIGLKKVDQDEYLTREANGSAVYTQITFHDYFRHKESKEFSSQEFFNYPERFESDFMRFAKSTDFYIAGHFWNSEAPFLFTREDAREEQFRIKVVADISCDIDGPVASTIRPSTIADPLYGYNPVTEQEAAFDAADAITVMAVDNLPCELPKDASRDFGTAFVDHVLPSFLNGDKDGVLERATIVKDGAITERFSHLRDWIKD